MQRNEQSKDYSCKKVLLGTGFFLPAVPECAVILDKKELDYGYSKF